jgi:NCAIR mutase (PurE)-related protein
MIPNDHTRYDFARPQRIGMPEAVLCEGKDSAVLAKLIEELCERPEHPVLFTRLDNARYLQFSDHVRTPLEYDPLSRTATLHGSLAMQPGRVALLTAGTADLGVAKEAQRTLHFMGYTTNLFADVGVAGLWRLMENLDAIQQHEVVIVIAGMDAALLAVVGGLISQPVIGVPTSTGYGVSSGGQSALHAMLGSCAQGMVVMNIDNGFGAACAAVRMLSLHRKSP